MGLFDKKYCDICGEKIGLFGNRKLEDGNLCKDCAAKLSPWFSERRSSTIAEIKEQLAYREANKEKVAAFEPVTTLGYGTKVMVDEGKGLFLITSASNWREANPDVLSLTDVTGCRVEVKESSDEIRTKDAEGKSISYDPPRYKAKYDFYVNVDVNHPWFSEMSFRVNPSTVVVDPIVQSLPAAFGGPSNRPGARVTKADPTTNARYVEYRKAAEDIKDALLKARDDVREAALPKGPVICPHCGATTVPDASGRCEYCGSPVV